MRGIILALLLTLAGSEKSPNDPLMAGATDNVFIMNSPTTTLPNGTQNSMQKKMANIVKTLTGFKRLPSKEPLITTYVKILGQEMFQNETTKETTQNSFIIKRQPTPRHSIIKLLNRLVGQWAQPILLSEVRQIQPTSTGLPLELSIHSAAVDNAAVNLNMKANQTPSSDLSVARFLQSNIQFHPDVTPSISEQTVASMGVNTHLVQPGTEFQSKIQAITPAQFTAKFDDKEKNVKDDDDIFELLFRRPDREHVRTIRTSQSSSSSINSSNSGSARRPQEKEKNFADVHNSVADRLKGHCLMTENMIKTFNDINYNYTMPGHCYHVLAQDCTEENKFLIVAKNSQENPEHKDINIKLGEFDFQMYSQSGEPMVKVNNIDISKKKLPYEPSQDPSVHIEERDGKLVLSAPIFGIAELVYDRKSTELRTVVWMRGQTCGICGRHDDDTGREFTMPDGSVAKDKESFGHSWILSEDACSGACKLHHSLVKTEKPEREENKCYSIHPVLRCAKGCTPSATTPVSVGFHCTSADLAEDESLIDRSEDFTEQVEAHTSCSCKSLQCVA